MQYRYLSKKKVSQKNMRLAVKLANVPDACTIESKHFSLTSDYSTLIHIDLLRPIAKPMKEHLDIFGPVGSLS